MQQEHTAREELWKIEMRKEIEEQDAEYERLYNKHQRNSSAHPTRPIPWWEKEEVSK